MPRLLLFVPCEKAIVDQQQNRASLISLIDDFRLTLGAQTIPEGAAIPMAWTIFALWRKDPADEGKTFVEECDLIAPDGKRLLHAGLEFQIDKAVHRTMLNINAFPISTASGEYTLHLFLKELREGAERREIATYPFIVTTGP